MADESKQYEHTRAYFDRTSQEDPPSEHCVSADAGEEKWLIFNRIHICLEKYFQTRMGSE